MRISNQRLSGFAIAGFGAIAGFTSDPSSPGTLCVTLVAGVWNKPYACRWVINNLRVIFRRKIGLRIKVSLSNHC